MWLTVDLDRVEMLSQLSVVQTTSGVTIVAVRLDMSSLTELVKVFLQFLQLSLAPERNSVPINCSY